MRARLEPAFLDGFGAGRRFALWVQPPTGTAARGAILCVQPFGEEANLARRVLVAQAVRLAASGWTTLIVDLFGTGDSDGATEEASLATWRSDLLRASRLARERAPGAFVLWGTRLGALLAAELAIALDQLVSAIVFWQPPASGAQLIDPLAKLARIGAIARTAGASAAAGSGVTGTGAAATAAAAGTARAGATANAARGSNAPSAATAGVAASALAASAMAAATVDAVGATRSRPSAPSPAESRMARPAGPSACVDLAGYRLSTDLLEDLRAIGMQPPALGEHSTPYPVLMLGMQRVVPPGAVAPRALSDLAGRWLEEGHLAGLRIVQAEPFWSSLEPSTPIAAFEETEAFLGSIDARS